MNLLLSVKEFSSAEILCLDLFALVSPLKHTVVTEGNVPGNLSSDDSVFSSNSHSSNSSSSERGDGVTQNLIM